MRKVVKTKWKKTNLFIDIIDFYSIFNKGYFKSAYNKSDNEKIRSDWYKVGIDIQLAIKNIYIYIYVKMKVHKNSNKKCTKISKKIY